MVTRKFFVYVEMRIWFKHIYFITSIHTINYRWIIVSYEDECVNDFVKSVNIASIANPYYLHRICIGKINRNYPVTRQVTDKGAQLVMSVVPH